MSINLKDAKVLLVDDEQANIEILAQALSGSYIVYEALSGEDALRIVDEKSPDLILLDIMMPEMDGYEVFEKIRELTKAQDIPVMFVTALGNLDHEYKGLEMGAVDYVVKPFNVSILRKRVENHLILKLTRDAHLRSDSEKGELLHVLCHDLVNPLFAINNLIKTLPDVSEQQKDMIYETIEKTSKAGLDVIEVVRKIRAVEDKKVGFELEEVNLETAINDSLEMLAPRFESKRIRVIIDLEPDCMVVAEKVSLINSVINNLLTNALKFSWAESFVKISVVREKGSVVLKIRDYGIGMSKYSLNILFDLKLSASRRGTDNEEGTGFGLPLVKKFVELYGASICVESWSQNDFPQTHGTLVQVSFKSAR